MKLNPTSRSEHAFTVTELVLVTVLVLVLGAILTSLVVQGLAKQRAKQERISCASNLKQIGLAYKVFANDNDDKFPFHVTNSLAFGNVTQAWHHFQAMSNELGSAKVLTCWSDRERINNRMADFGMGSLVSAQSLSSKGNRAVSYTASLDGHESLPNVILSSDRHLLTNRFNMDGRLFLAMPTGSSQHGR